MEDPKEKAKELWKIFTSILNRHYRGFPPFATKIDLKEFLCQKYNISKEELEESYIPYQEADKYLKEKADIKEILLNALNLAIDLGADEFLFKGTLQVFPFTMVIYEELFDMDEKVKISDEVALIRNKESLLVSSDIKTIIKEFWILFNILLPIMHYQVFQHEKLEKDIQEFLQENYKVSEEELLKFNEVSQEQLNKIYSTPYNVLVKRFIQLIRELGFLQLFMEST